MIYRIVVERKRVITDRAVVDVEANDRRAAMLKAVDAPAKFEPYLEVIDGTSAVRVVHEGRL